MPKQVGEGDIEVTLNALHTVPTIVRTSTQCKGSSYKFGAIQIVPWSNLLEGGEKPDNPSISSIFVVLQRRGNLLKYCTVNLCAPIDKDNISDLKSKQN